MKLKFADVKFDPATGTFAGTRDGVRFSACPDLFLIGWAWAKGADFEDLADGYGEGLGTMGGDWSGIRDSTREAKDLMFTRALNFLKAV